MRHATLRMLVSDGEAASSIAPAANQILQCTLDPYEDDATVPASSSNVHLRRPGVQKNSVHRYHLFLSLTYWVSFPSILTTILISIYALDNLYAPTYRVTIRLSTNTWPRRRPIPASKLGYRTQFASLSPFIAIIFLCFSYSTRSTVIHPLYVLYRFVSLVG